MLEGSDARSSLLWVWLTFRAVTACKRVAFATSGHGESAQGGGQPLVADKDGMDDLDSRAWHDAGGRPPSAEPLTSLVPPLPARPHRTVLYRTVYRTVPKPWKLTYTTVGQVQRSQ